MLRVDLRHDTPEGYRALAALTRAGHPDHALAELMKIRASQINGCVYCIDLHTGAARRRGERDERINALECWRESDLFDTRERAALDLCELLTRSTDLAKADSRGAASTWDAASVTFPTPELGQVVMTITGINAWNRIMIASGVAPGD